MNNTPIPQEDYPFFTAAPVKKSAGVWKAATILLASCLAVSVYLMSTGFRFGSPAPEATEPNQTTALAAQVTALTEANRQLEAELSELTRQNSELSARVLTLLNECNELSRDLEQGKNGGLTESEVTKMKEDLENYELIMDTYIAMIRRDKTSLEANVEKLMPKIDLLPAEARNALYILLEYMDRF